MLDKPPDVSVQSTDPDSRDDLVSRFAGWCSSPQASAPLRPRLRVHGHLDRDLSGIVVLSDRNDIHASMSRLVAEARMTISFVVAVQTTKLSGTSTLRAKVAPNGDGPARPARERTRRAEEVTIVASLLARQSDRCLVQLDAPTCGPRSARAVLAATVGAVVGDTTLGGPRAARLMMHASSLALDHPETGRRMRLSAPPPWCFEAWLNGQGVASGLTASHLTEAIADAIARRHGLLMRGQTSAVRLVHGEADWLEGIDVEWFGGHAVVWADEQVPAHVREQVVDELTGVGALGVYLKVRPKHASRIADARRAALVQARPVRGQAAPTPRVVVEDGLHYALELGEGLGTGLFLDQRRNRAWLRSVSRGKAVLNLFAYTCAFTVAAAAGGAARTVSVDASARVLALGRRNLEANGLAGPHHALVCDDVVKWLSEARRRGTVFDVVVLDPPSFSTTRASRLSVQKDYESLARACLKVLSPAGGVLLACTNHRGTLRTRLRSWLRRATSACSRPLISLRDVRPEADFPATGGEPHMKAVVCEVGEATGQRAVGRSGRARRTTTKNAPRTGGR